MSDIKLNELCGEPFQYSEGGVEFHCCRSAGHEGAHDFKSKSLSSMYFQAAAREKPTEPYAVTFKAEVALTRTNFLVRMNGFNNSGTISVVFNQIPPDNPCQARHNPSPEAIAQATDTLLAWAAKHNFEVEP